MASEKFTLYQGYYTSGKWTKQMVHMAAERGHITHEEYATITGEEYVPIVYKYEGGNLTDLVEKKLITGDPNATSNTHSSDSGSGEEDDGGSIDNTGTPTINGGADTVPPEEPENGGE